MFLSAIPPGQAYSEKPISPLGVYLRTRNSRPAAIGMYMAGNVIPSRSPRPAAKQGMGRYIGKYLGDDLSYDPNTGYTTDLTTGVVSDSNGNTVDYVTPETPAPPSDITLPNVTPTTTAIPIITAPGTTATATATAATPPASTNLLTQIFSAITGATQTATTVAQAQNLNTINAQRAAQGLLPVNAAGQIVGTSTTALSATGLTLPVLALIVGGVVLLASSRKS